jgi:OmpA-OmpF porin, OOP family
MNKIVDKALDTKNQAVDEVVDKSVDGAVEKAKEDNTKKEENSEGEQNTDNGDTSTDDSGQGTKKDDTKGGQPKLESYSKYDFVPGDQVLFFEDFSQDAVGDFPALWTTNGSGEVRTLNLYPGHWLYMNSAGNVYTLMQDLTLPDNFVLELDVVSTPQEEGSDNSSFCLTLYQSEGEYLDAELFPGIGGFHVTCRVDAWEVTGYTQSVDQMMSGSSALSTIDINTLDHVIIWVQKRRLRIYNKGQKAVDLPTVLFTQNKYNRLRFSLWGQYGFPYITNIRFTSAAPDMRSKLLTEGKLVCYGIYFDVNSDKLKPESYGSLKQIADVLKENPDVRIKIVGHTDSDGDDAKNLDLSKRRAASVKDELNKNFGIDASRIETDGKGETQPVVPNTTSEGKAKNRRVEFLKL